MQYELIGTTMQALVLQLEPGEQVYTESGAMAWMSDTIQMQSGFRGGLMGTVSRWLAGESLAVTTFTAGRKPGEVAFSTAVPGKVVPMAMQPGRSIICQAGSFLCAEPGVEMKIHLKKKLLAGMFGGEGFILERLSGKGMAFFEVDGEVVEKRLAPGQVLLVDTGHIAMFEDTVSFDVTLVKGVRNWLFGGEGLFLATLKGPGRVWLQTMPFANLAAQVGSSVATDGIREIVSRI